MSKKSIILLTVLGLGACETMSMMGDSPTPTTCGEPGGGITPTNVTYDEARIQATPVTKIRAGKKWKIKLNGVGTSLDTAIVTITGKLPGDTWVTAAGREADSPLFICVPDTLSVGDQIYFSINVQFVGMLDPRADVVY